MTRSLASRLAVACSLRGHYFQALDADPVAVTRHDKNSSLPRLLQSIFMLLHTVPTLGNVLKRLTPTVGSIFVCQRVPTTQPIHRSLYLHGITLVLGGRPPLQLMSFARPAHSLNYDSFFGVSSGRLVKVFPAANVTAANSFVIIIPARIS